MQQVQFRSEHLLAPCACVLLFLVVLIAVLWKLQQSEAARDESKLLGSSSYKTQALDDGRVVRRSTRCGVEGGWDVGSCRGVCVFKPTMRCIRLP